MYIQFKDKIQLQAETVYGIPTFTQIITAKAVLSKGHTFKYL